MLIPETVPLSVSFEKMKETETENGPGLLCISHIAFMSLGGKNKDGFQVKFQS